MTVQPNHDSSAGLRTLQPGKSALRLPTACGCSLHVSGQGGKCPPIQMPGNPGSNEDAISWATVLKFGGRKCILNSTSVRCQ